MNTEDFIIKAKSVHGNKYDYSLTHYINALTKVTIICPVHGQFIQNPHVHTSNECGCKKCALTISEEKSLGLRK